MAASDKTVCAITAAMQHGTGLDQFASEFSSRFFDVGIAEGHAVCMAAGLAKQGMKPVTAIYSTFLQRAYDMLLHDVALQQLHVVLAVDRCGVVGEDGDTHQGMFDVGYLRQVPGMKIFCPASFDELREDLHTALYACTGPAAIRYPRGSEGAYRSAASQTRIREGYTCTIICYGTMVNAVLDAADTMQAAGYRPEILKLRTISPVDWDAIDASVRKTKRVFVFEETSDRECLADEIFVYSLYYYFRNGGALEGDAFGSLHFYRMGISYVKHKLVAVDRRLVTDAVDDKLSLEAGGNADYHVVYESSVKTVLGSVFLHVVGTRENKLAVVHFAFDAFADILRKLTFGTFDAHDGAVYFDFHARRYGYGRSSYS